MGRELILNDEGKILLREARANGVNDIGIKAPATLAASYTLTWMAALPGSIGIALCSAGAM